MKQSISFLLLLLIFSFFAAECRSQGSAGDRPPAVAGQFYPSDKNELKKMLSDLFAKAVPSKKLQNVLAVICPHAGYVYSGIVAASGFNQVDPSKQYDNIFVLGPSHHVGFDGASVYTGGNFITPMGTVKVNRELAENLIRKYNVFTARADAHMTEHSIEVQLPFLQYILKKDFKIVPIVIGGINPETCKKIGDALRPYLNAKNLFVVSTDLSHYPPYDEAVKVDKATTEAILSRSPENLLRAVESNSQKDVPNLATSLCGESGVLALLFMTGKLPGISLDLIQYRNSGDSEAGDKTRVVGYCSIAVSYKETRGKPKFDLGEADMKNLMGIARNTLIGYIAEHAAPRIDTSGFSYFLKANCGAFVTLRKNNSLRGCIGRFDSDEPLYKVVQDMAIASSTQDYRFPPVDADEIPGLEIEISVLTPMRKINSIDEIEMGKHGIYIKKGSRSGTFLPQVAAETGWSKEEFLGHCAQDKAQIGWDGWKTAEIYVYEAFVFSESQLNKK